MLFPIARGQVAILTLGYWIANGQRTIYSSWMSTASMCNLFFHSYSKPVLMFVYPCKPLPCTFSSHAKETGELWVFVLSDNMTHRCVRDARDSRFQYLYLWWTVICITSMWYIVDEEDSITLVTSLFQVNMSVLFLGFFLFFVLAFS